MRVHTNTKSLNLNENTWVEAGVISTSSFMSHGKLNPQTKIQKTYVKWNLGSIWPQNLIEPYKISVGEPDLNVFLFEVEIT